VFDLHYLNPARGSLSRDSSHYVIIRTNNRASQSFASAFSMGGFSARELKSNYVPLCSNSGWRGSGEDRGLLGGYFMHRHIEDGRWRSSSTGPYASLGQSCL